MVILASNFERVQIIPGSAFGEEAIVTCVDCCLDSGKVDYIFIGLEIRVDIIFTFFMRIFLVYLFVISVIV